MKYAEPVLGGAFVCRPSPIRLPIGEEVGLRLMSDLHIGAPHVDYKLIGHELAHALEHSDRIALNGDVWDFILPKDHKRYDPAAIHPRLASRTDLINAAIEWAVELFGPVAHLIDMIGVGNHETAVTKYHAIDPTLLLIYELEKIAHKRNKEHVIHYGGYTGYVDYRLNRSMGGKGRYGGYRWVLWYHHGSGGASPVTKGMIDFNRKDVFVDADCVWLGHKHNRNTDHTLKIYCPEQGDDLHVRDVRHVQTGAYFNTYVGQSQASVRRHGRRSNYAADWGCAPAGKGGARVVLTMKRDGIKAEVRQ